MFPNGEIEGGNQLSQQDGEMFPNEEIEGGNGKQRNDGFWDDNAPKSELLTDVNLPLLVIGTKQVS